MRATVDISLYPLSDTYRKTIIDFVLDLRKHPELEIDTDGVSTKIRGDYDVLMDILKHEMKEVLEETKAVFIIKLYKGDRRKENLPAVLLD